MATTRAFPHYVPPSLEGGGVEAWRHKGESGCRFVPGSIFKRNEHGHILITFQGLQLSGEREIARAGEAGVHVTRYAKLCLKSGGVDSYDARHRLVAFREYTVAVVPGSEILDDSVRSTEALVRLAVKKYHYKKSPHPQAESLLRAYEKMFGGRFHMETHFESVTALHTPIGCGDSHPRVLTGRLVGSREIDAKWGSLSDLWDSRGCFIFEV